MPISPAGLRSACAAVVAAPTAQQLHAVMVSPALTVTDWINGKNRIASERFIVVVVVVVVFRNVKCQFTTTKIVLGICDR